MRTTFGRNPAYGLRVSSAIPLLAAAALLVAACSDEPTDPGTDTTLDEPIQEFVTTPEALTAAHTAAMRSTHHLPTLERRPSAISFSETHKDPVSSPFDLTYFGGPVVNAAKSFNIFVNCADGPASCWGTGALTPTTFLRDLNHDDFIRVVNEFINSDARNNFPASELKTTATFSQPHTATIDDVLGIVLSAVNHTQASGYTSIYHVFLPEGTDMCFDPTTCYSPDNFDTFVFCAFHSSVDFDANTHVLFSVEPYQAVPGCQIPGQTPHGVIDATASTLSHELMETITDPDGNAWFNGLFGFEGSDICTALASNQHVNGHDYFLQLEYSNKRHGCVTHA